MTTGMFDVSPAATHSGSKIRKTVTRGLLVAAMTGGLAFGMAMPAFAAAPADVTTGTTFQTTGGLLTFTASANATLADGTRTTSEGAITISGPLGAVAVTDARGVATGWTLSAVSGVFTSGTGDTSTDVTYATGPIEVTGTVTASDVAATQIMTPKVAVAVPATGAHGNNGATFNPTLAVTLPGGALAGTYTGTVTTSVL